MCSIKFNGIVAICNENQGIGKNNDLPWDIPDDFNYFLRVINTLKNSNKQNALILGRLTWESMKGEVIPNHYYFIVSSKLVKSNLNQVKGLDMDKLHVCGSVDEAVCLIKAKLADKIETIYSLGGAEIYKATVESSHFDRFYLTRILEPYECDVCLKPDNFFSGMKKLESHELKEESELFQCDYNTVKIDSKSGARLIFEVYEKVKN